MRRLGLIVSVLAILIGLPKLADKLRQTSRNPNVTPGEQDKKIAAAPLPSSENSLPASPQALEPVKETLPVAVTPSPLPVSITPAPPATAAKVEKSSEKVTVPVKAEEIETREQLVTAIQKELARLGYYDGPITPKWTKQARMAAQKFVKKTGSRVRYVRPTEELLNAARSVSPQKANGNTSNASEILKKEALNQPTEKESSESPKALPPSSAATVESAKLELTKTEEYLPPWMRLETSNAPIPPDPIMLDKTASIAPADFPANPSFDSSPASTPPLTRKAKLKRKAQKIRTTMISTRDTPKKSARSSSLRQANFSWPGQ